MSLPTSPKIQMPDFPIQFSLFLPSIQLPGFLYTPVGTLQPHYFSLFFCLGFLESPGSWFGVEDGPGAGVPYQAPLQFLTNNNGNRPGALPITPKKGKLATVASPPFSPWIQSLITSDCVFCCCLFIKLEQDNSLFRHQFKISLHTEVNYMIQWPIHQIKAGKNWFTLYPILHFLAWIVVRSSSSPISFITKPMG